MNDLIEHALIHFGTRTIEVLDEEGYSQKVKFEWGKSQQEAFEQLKRLLSNAETLSLPDWSTPFHVMQAS